MNLCLPGTPDCDDSYQEIARIVSSIQDDINDFTTDCN